MFEGMSDDEEDFQSVSPLYSYVEYCVRKKDDAGQPERISVSKCLQ